MSDWSAQERAWLLLIVAVIGLSVYYGFDDKPKPPTKPTPTMTQAQIERDAAIDFAIYYTLNIEARLQRLERERQPLLPDVRTR